MPIEKITQRIFSDAKKEAAKLTKEAEAEAKTILKEAEIEAEKQATVVVAKAKIQAQDEKKRVLAMARLESRDLILREKRQTVDSVFQLAREKVLALPDEKYLALIKKLVFKAVETGEEEVIVSPKDKKRIDQGFLNEVNRELEKQGKPGELKQAAETKELQGGFVLKQGGIETNSSLPVLIDSIRGELESEIIKVLLG